ncbi:MAG: hypothetical protein P4L84_06740 [Isosphaeraceae bacterium]|nr:hypothetical protein [Isosphaeraceae bacterium]
MRALHCFLIAGRVFIAAGALVVVPSGCGGSNEAAAGNDPVARAQTEADAKRAMDAAAPPKRKK